MECGLNGLVYREFEKLVEFSVELINGLELTTP